MKKLSSASRPSLDNYLSIGPLAKAPFSTGSKKSFLVSFRVVE